MTTNVDDYLKPAEYAVIIKRTRRHVSNMVRDGRIPPEKILRDGKRSYRIHRSALPDWAPKVTALPALRLSEQDKREIARYVAQELGRLFGHAAEQGTRSIG